eukprot:scaffold8013_cov187-Ochromonas_danica.AAC.5
MDVLRETDSNARLVGKALTNQLYPLLSQIKYRLSKTTDQDSKEDHLHNLTLEEREKLLTIYTTLSGQLETLWEHIDPQIALSTVLPRGLPQDSSAPPVPMVLSTYIAPQEQGCIYLPQSLPSSSTELSTEEEMLLEGKLSQNIKSIDEIVENFSERIETFQAKCQQRIGGGSSLRKRKRKEKL